MDQEYFLGDIQPAETTNWVITHELVELLEKTGSLEVAPVQPRSVFAGSTRAHFLENRPRM